ncbi:MAG: hypothetical protein M5U19_03310 [Microthrixaceae bacterium]|nr:hypothetical protein [Microthrixaceae bacterium]
MPDRFLVTREPTVTLTHTLATAATDSSGVLLRSFAIALVIMAPIALWQARRIRERRRRQRSDSYQQATDLSSLSSGDGYQGRHPRVPGGGDQPGGGNARELPDHRTDRAGRTDHRRKPADPQLVEVVLRCTRSQRAGRDGHDQQRRLDPTRMSSPVTGALDSARMDR